MTKSIHNMTEIKKVNRINKYALILSILAGIITLILVFTLDYLKSDFNIMMTIVYILLCFVPLLLSKFFKWDIPNYMVWLYHLFILFSTLGGTVYGLYDLISFYDIILHFLSGVLLGGMGLYIFRKLTKKENKSLILLFIFIVGFSVLCGVLWEIWEFSADHLFGYNCQKYCLPTQEVLVGHEAIIDTMIDLICDLLGAVLFAIITICVLKRNKSNT